jgi:hypothetical protein
MSSRPALLVTLAAALGVGAVVGYRKLIRRTVTTEEAEVSILDPDDTVHVHRSGAVGSVQEAEIVVERDFLERIWNPDSLELLARGYWAFLRRMTLGIIRVVYAHDSRTVTAFGFIPLLRFGTPRYETEGARGQVTWPIDRGLLVAREGRGEGHLRVSVRRCDRDGVDDDSDAELDHVRIIARVEVENFYPGLRGRGRFASIGAWFYAQTQLRIHVIVCNAYLLSLAKLDFPDIDTSAMPSDREPAGRLEPAGR